MEIPQEREQMKLTRIHENVDVNGTCLVGYVYATYADLVEKLGSPTCLGDIHDKTQAEWYLEFEAQNGDKVVATLYDWKQYEEGIPQGRYDWHIGGHDPRAVNAVADLLGTTGWAYR